MATWGGIDDVIAGDRIITLAYWDDGAAPPVPYTTGTATVAYYKWSNTGTLTQYDFSDNTFKSSPTTGTASMTHRAVGQWSYVLTTLTGFAQGDVITEVCTHSVAGVLPPRVRTYGRKEADIRMVNGTAVSDSSGRLNVNVTAIGATTVSSFTANNFEVFFSNGSSFSNTAVVSMVNTLNTRLTSTRATNLDNLDAAVSSRLASASYTAAPTAAAVASQVRTELTTELGRIDTTISSRLATASYTAAPSAATVASQVRTELTTELGRIDVATSTRLASASYTAPDNAGITAIKAETDKLATMVVDAGSDGDYEFTADALANAPTGGGGGTADWTSTEKEQIRWRLGLDGTASAPTTTVPHIAGPDRLSVYVPGGFVRPETGTEAIEIWIETRNPSLQLSDADSFPTITITGDQSGDLSANLGVVAKESTGDYRVSYSLAFDAPLEQLTLSVTATIGGNPFNVVSYPTDVTEYVAPLASSIPTAEENASAVRTELATELARLDVATSTRLAAASYTAPTTPPTVSEIAAGILVTPANKIATDASNNVSVDAAAIAAGIDVSGMTAEQDAALFAIKGQTDKLGSGEATVVNNAGITEGGAIQITIADDWEAVIEVDADLSEAQEVWLTIKTYENQEDIDSVIQISLTEGLMIVNGCAATDASLGSLEVTGTEGNQVVLTLAADITEDLKVRENLRYDLKQRTAAGKRQRVTKGNASVIPTVTRAIG